MKDYKSVPPSFSGESSCGAKNGSQKKYSALGSIVIIDFIVGILFVGDGYLIPGIGVPASVLGLVIIVVLGFFRKPKRCADIYFFMLLIVLLSVLWTTGVSLVMDASTGETVRRAGRMAMLLLCCLFLIEERIDFNSLVKGLCAGLFVNFILFYAGIAPDAYGGYLTGYLVDKNKAGLYYLVGGMLAMGISKKTWLTVALLFAAGGSVWLTGSRTTLAALLVAILWVLVATRMPKVPRCTFVLALVFLIDYLERNFAHFGAFADRVGSDLLRQRIDMASLDKLEKTPFKGLGFGEAHVIIENRKWYFHNSYWTLLVEGGVIHFLIIVVITLALGLGIFRNVAYTVELRRAEGALAGLFVAASRLGEVFLTNAWMLVISFLVVAVLNAKSLSCESDCGSRPPNIGLSGV
ncbi:O-antigen ligase family protein [Dermabacteraceae bacterium P7074]